MVVTARHPVPGSAGYDVAMSIFLLALPALGAPDLPSAIGTILERCSTASHPLPELSPDQIASLVGSQVVRIVKHGDPKDPSTAVGIAILRGGRDALWIAAQDPHAQVDPSLDEFVVEWLGVDQALWYGHLDLPRPLRDRQWVVESGNNHGLARSTGDVCWEHRWSLVDDGLPRARQMVAEGAAPRVTLAQVDDAIYTPVNHGAWLMAPLSSVLPGDDRVLVAYQATSVVGGAIPDWLVLQLSMSRLESVLKDLEQRAGTWSRTHYRAGHEGVVGGAGKPIPLFP